MSPVASTRACVRLPYRAAMRPPALRHAAGMPHLRSQAIGSASSSPCATAGARPQGQRRIRCPTLPLASPRGAPLKQRTRVVAGYRHRSGQGRAEALEAHAPKRGADPAGPEGARRRGRAGPESGRRGWHAAGITRPPCSLTCQPLASCFIPSKRFRAWLRKPCAAASSWAPLKAAQGIDRSQCGPRALPCSPDYRQQRCRRY
jgi:hypothetical protein